MSLSATNVCNSDRRLAGHGLGELSHLPGRVRTALPTAGGSVNLEAVFQDLMALKGRHGLPISYSPGNLKKIVSHESKEYNALNLLALKLMALSALFSAFPGDLMRFGVLLGSSGAREAVLRRKQSLAGGTPGNWDRHYYKEGRIGASSGSWPPRKNHLYHRY